MHLFSCVLPLFYPLNQVGYCALSYRTWQRARGPQHPQILVTVAEDMFVDQGLERGIRRWTSYLILGHTAL